MTTQSKKPAAKRKPLTPEQKAKKAAKAKEAREAKIKAAEEVKPETPVEDSGPEELKAVEQEFLKLEADVKEALDNGFHNKAFKLVEHLPDNAPFKVEVHIKAADMRDKASTRSSGIRPVKQKEITSEQVLKKWQELVDLLEKFTSQQQLAKRPWRHIFQAFMNTRQRRNQFSHNIR